MITTFLYQKGKPFEKNIDRARMHQALRDKEALLWVDLENPDDFEIECLVEIFNFHDLAIDDCLNDLSQPKVDDYDEYLFLVLHAVNLEGGSGQEELLTVEINIFLGPNFVVTFHKGPIQSVTQIRELASKKPETFIGQGPDKLVYYLLDYLVEKYQPVLDLYDAQVDLLEEEIFNQTKSEQLSDIMKLKKDLFHFRRTVAPQRDTINFLTRTDTGFIRPENMPYFRDVFDHLFRIYGMIEGLHEAVTGLMQVYFSYSSHKLNDSIKRMTVMATITMPPVVIASIYGMNFEHMPELSMPFGYFGSLILMAATSISVLIVMKWKKWI